MTRYIEEIEVRRIPDDDGDASWLEQSDADMGEGFEAQSRERLAALARGDWGFVGVMARAHIRVAGVSQVIESAGLWGIESDSEESYFDLVAGEQLRELRETLLALGFTADDFAEQCAPATMLARCLAAVEVTI